MTARHLRPHRRRDHLQIREGRLHRSGPSVHGAAGKRHVFRVADEVRLKLIKPCRAIEALSLGRSEQRLVKGTRGRGECGCEL